MAHKKRKKKITDSFVYSSGCGATGRNCTLPSMSRRQALKRHAVKNSGCVSGNFFKYSSKHVSTSSPSGISDGLASAVYDVSLSHGGSPNIKVGTTTKIRELMPADDLTNDVVKSHLQILLCAIVILAEITPCISVLRLMSCRIDLLDCGC